MTKRRLWALPLLLTTATLSFGGPLTALAAPSGAPAAPAALTMTARNGNALAARAWIAQSSVTLRFTVPAFDTAVTPQIEVERAKVPFTGRPTASGTPTTAAETASFALSHLSDGRYHWQARTTSAAGSSPWVPFNAGGIAFRIATHPPRVTWVDSHGGAFVPSRGPVSVHFRLNRNARVAVSIYRVGSKVPIRTLLFNHVRRHQLKTVKWSGKTRSGKTVALGKYFFGLRATDPAHNQARSHFGLFTVVVPTARPATPNTAVGGKHIVISLSRQALYAYDGSRLVLQTLVTTGNPVLPTPVGNYSIMAKLSPFEFVSPWPPGSPFYYPPSWTQHAMLFRAGGYYIHDAPWRSAFGPGTNGEGQPGTNYGGTHGCVNVPSTSMDALWDWTPIGTPVEVIP